MGSLWIYCKRFLRFLSDPDRLCCSPFWKLITASRILAGARHVARRATEGRRLKGTLPVASLQTSFGVRLSRIHFSPLRGGEMNAWQTNRKERLRGGYPASRVSFDLPRYLKGDRGTKCRVKKKRTSQSSQNAQPKTQEVALYWDYRRMAQSWWYYSCLVPPLYSAPRFIARVHTNCNLTFSKQN